MISSSIKLKDIHDKVMNSILNYHFKSSNFSKYFYFIAVVCFLIVLSVLFQKKTFEVCLPCVQYKKTLFYVYLVCYWWNKM